MRLIDYFGHAYVINLADRNDRMREMRDEFARINMEIDVDPIERFDAVRPTDKGDFPTIGTRGCFYSHLRVVQRARAEGLTRIWVLEDDVAFDRRLALHSAELIEQLEAQPDWDIVYLGHAGGPKTQVEDPTPQLVQTQDPMRCLHCFALQAKVYDRLIEFLESCLARPAGDPDGGPMHVDGAYSMFRARNPDVKVLAARPSLAGQRSSRTDIHDLGLLDRLPVAGDVMSALRRLKNKLR